MSMHRNHNKFIVTTSLVTITLLTLMFSACKLRDNSETKFIVSMDGVGVLMKHARDLQIQICVTATDKAMVKGYENWIYGAVVQWLSKLMFLDKHVTRNIQLNCQEYILKVHFVSGFGRSNHAVPNKALGSFSPIITIYAGFEKSYTKKQRQAVLLHELGHAFGLRDTYSEKKSGMIPNQPKSVMGNLISEAIHSISKDDIRGLVTLYGTIWQGKHNPPVQNYQEIPLETLILHTLAQSAGAYHSACFFPQVQQLTKALESLGKPFLVNLLSSKIHPRPLVLIHANTATKKFTAPIILKYQYGSNKDTKKKCFVYRS